jgi:hypothetical protein
VDPSSGWTSPCIAEEIASKSDSIEHLTLLMQQPNLPVNLPQYLELRATPRLNKGGSLWAEG